MKKPLLVTGTIFAALILLFIFNKVTSNRASDDIFAEVAIGDFLITVEAAGELVPENSINVAGPEMAAGRDIRASRIRIQDIVTEGTIVKKGDYIARLDGSELSNNLKDALERLTTMRQNLEVRLLDTAVQLTGLRDQIENQILNLEEAEMNLTNSKFEPPTVIRQAEINVEQARRVLDQRRRSYTRRQAQLNTDIRNQKMWIGRMERRVNDLQEVLAGFTIKAPADGMVMYKREWNGTKRKAGSYIDPRDKVVATLPDLNTMLSKIYVSEIDINKLQSGQEVEINVDAFPSKIYKGKVAFIANIGEKLPNTSDKVFEVLIRLDGSDPMLRPSMTTGNKITINEFKDVIHIPAECIYAGIDSIPYVYKKNGTRQVVITGMANDKNMIIEKGLDPGTLVYLGNPANPEKFRLSGEELIPEIRERERQRREMNNVSVEMLGSN